VASGAATFGALTVGAAAQREIVASGAGTFGALTASGTAERQVTASGGATFGALTADGTATVTAGASAPTVAAIVAEITSSNAPNIDISSLSPESGDEIVVFIASNQVNETFNCPGYTELLDAVAVTSLTRGLVYRKTSDGTETTINPVRDDAGFGRWAAVACVVKGTSGLDVSNMGSSTTEADTPAPGVTTTAANCLILSAWFAATNLTASALPATALGEGWGGLREWCGVSYTTQASAGASTPLALTAASANRRAVTVAFAP
jgi:hypothetical protein